MKKYIFRITLVVAFAAIAGYNVYTSQQKTEMSDLTKANVEALAGGESTGSGYGCGRAAYEWDDDWYEDTKKFTICKSGCPEGRGTSPMYMDCF